MIAKADDMNKMKLAKGFPEEVTAFKLIPRGTKWLGSYTKRNERKQMTKYELLYGVTVDDFPNERQNVRRN